MNKTVLKTVLGRRRRPSISSRRYSTMAWMSRFSKMSPKTLLCSPHRDIHHGSGQVVGSNYLVREHQPKCGVDRAQQAVAEIRLPPRRHWVDVRGSENVNAGKAPGEQRVLGLSLVACEGNPTSSRRVRATAAQEGERCVGAAAMENSCELHRVVHCYGAEPCVRYRPGIRTQAEDRCVLIREHLRECRTVGEVLMENLFNLECEMPTFLRPMVVTSPTAGCSSAYRSAQLPTIPVAPTITRFFWPAVGTLMSDSEALVGPTRFVAVMRVRAPFK